jgi:hypothetical protein
MSKLLSPGVQLATPARTERDLAQVLSDLGVGQGFGPAAITEVYSELGKIVGGWHSEQYRLEVSDVGRALLSVARCVGEASRSLGGLETGIHSDLEIAVTTRVAQILALDPAVGSRAQAQELISSFRAEADRIAHVCMVARADLPNRPGESGRPPLAWYDDFTALLLGIAKKAGVDPSLRKDRVTGARSGWLFDAAQGLESFLWKDMRSPSSEACGKRLERSLRKVRGPKRQNRHRR